MDAVEDVRVDARCSTVYSSDEVRRKHRGAPFARALHNLNLNPGKPYVQLHILQSSLVLPTPLFCLD